MPALSALVIKDIRHHAPIWAWSLLVAITGGAFIGVTVISLHSAVSWSHGRENSAELLQAASIIGSNLVGYAGLTTALVLATTLALTVSAQQRSHALWKVLGVAPARIRTIIIRQVALVGVAGGALGAALAPAVARLYLASWREFDLYPADMPVVMPLYAPPLTILLTTVFCVLGGLGAARRAASTPEMQALREAVSPPSRTRAWQWVIAGILVLAAIMLPVMDLIDDEALMEGQTGMARAEELAMIEQMRSPAGRATTGGAMGMVLALAALCVPAWSLRPLLAAWTALIPARGAAWFAARANALHRSSLSLTTITPFAIAVAMTGTVYATVGAGRALGEAGGVSGFLAIAVPIFVVSGVGGVANIAMVGASRRQEAALLGVLGATETTATRSMVLEGAMYAVTGILFGLGATLVSATAAALHSGGGGAAFLGAIPLGTLGPVVLVCLVLAVATTWIPGALDRRPALDRLRQPV